MFSVSEISPVPGGPPVPMPAPPVTEPEPDRLPDETPNPNPDEADAPPLSVSCTVFSHDSRQ